MYWTIGLAASSRSNLPDLHNQHFRTCYWGDRFVMCYRPAPVAGQPNLGYCQLLFDLSAYQNMLMVVLSNCSAWVAGQLCLG